MAVRSFIISIFSTAFLSSWLFTVIFTSLRLVSMF
jgi:hypothetical protein